MSKKNSSFLVFSFFLALSLSGCQANKNPTPLTPNEVASSELFNASENWKPINSDSSIQNTINNKVVK